LADLEREPGGLDISERPGGRSNRTRWVILGLVVMLALGYMVYAAFPGNALYFLTVSEFMSKEEVRDGRTVRVSGKLVDGSFRRDGNAVLARFEMTDKDGATVGQPLAATYVGVLPDLFFNPYSEIILEGSYGPGGVFQTDNILVKCPSKYRSLEEESQDSG
jgi:cytochrome c-type biogenesis protein CcmE